MGRYPEDDERLASLVKAPDSDDADRWKGPYIKRQAKDPWGEAYHYFYPGFINTEGFDVVSFGSDRAEGGQGEFDKDIGNWEEEEGFE